MVKSLQFSGKIDKTPSDGGWHYILIPSEVHAELRQLAGKKGNVPVTVTIGQTPFATTTMSMGQQRWFFAVKAAVRQAENLSEGDAVSIEIAPDFKRIKQS